MSKTEGHVQVFFNAHLLDERLDTSGALLAMDGKIHSVFVDPQAKETALQVAADLVGSTVVGNLVGSAPAETSHEPQCIDCQGLVLTPSFIDLHAHFREPGLTHKEDLESASRAAAAGGFGTAVLMANTNPIISTEAAALEINQNVRKLGYIDAYQVVSITRDFDGSATQELLDLTKESVPIISEDGKDVESSSVMLEAMKIAAAKNLTVSCHCEDSSLAIEAKKHRDAYRGSGDANELKATERLLALAENIMTDRNIALAEEAGCHVHIAHISTAQALDAVRRAKKRATTCISCEVTPHHLALNDSVPAIVNPPLRPESDRLALIQGILDGTIDAIATDHAPHTASEKADGAPGFTGIQTAFAVCNTALVRTKIISLSRLSSLMAANPARILEIKKGLLEQGYAADLVLLDPAAPNTAEPQNAERWYSKSTNTAPYSQQLYGEIVRVFKAGKELFN